MLFRPLIAPVAGLYCVDPLRGGADVVQLLLNDPVEAIALPTGINEDDDAPQRSCWTLPLPDQLLLLADNPTPLPNILLFPLEP